MSDSEITHLVELAIKKKYADASSFDHSLTLPDFLSGDVYYTEFHTSAIQDKSDMFEYAYVQKGRVTLFDNGVSAIQNLCTELDRRRTLLQRFSDFGFVDVVSATIALLITSVFVFLLVRWNVGQTADVKPGVDPVPKEVLSIFSMVMGYYFGRNVAPTKN